MENYDKWKLESPYDDEDYNKENECIICGDYCEGSYCSRKCYLADINE